MNVYDFDKTIYDGDSAIDFYLFCLRKHPYIIKKFPRQVFSFIKYKLKLIDKLQFKENFYSYFLCLKNIDNDIDLFWNKNSKKIKKWYINQKTKNDLVISASPEFFLKPICKKLNINLLASMVNKKTGKYISLNCYGEEKVNRFKEVYINKKINNFYTDSKSDMPLVSICTKAYLVKKNKVVDWPYDVNENKKI